MATSIGRTVVLAVLLLAVPAAHAHDFWLEPSTHRTVPGALVEVTLRVGDGAVAERYPRNPAHVDRFVLVGGAGELPVPGATGDDPAGRVRVPAAGPWWLGYRSHGTFVTLDSHTFETYLQKEGLDDVLEARAARAENGQAAAEMFSRCAKALVWAGPPADDAAARTIVTTPLGFTLELVPEADPARLAAGAELPVRLLFQGAPLADALVDARPMTEATAPISRRTDAAGRVRLPLARGGVWLVAAVHMAPVVGPSRATWESWWASLTFEVPPG